MAMIEAETLKPCPFCGSETLRNLQVFVTCRNCGASGPGRTQDNDAIVEWNTRAEVKTESLWRFNGEVWEHKCADVQAEYFPAVKTEAEGAEGR